MNEPVKTYKTSYEAPIVQAIDEDIWNDSDNELTDMFGLMR